MGSSSGGDYSKFTFRLDEKDYKGSIPEHFSTPEFGGSTTKRFIGVKFIPKGTMMFHSYRQEEPLPGETAEQTVNRNLANFLQRYCLNICEYEKETDSFKICFTTEGNKSKFFFPAPCAGFGLMYAENYNTTMLCVTKRDTYVAYLKSGYFPDDSMIVHRKIPFSSGDLINFDGDRIVNCERLNSEYTCMTTDNTDPCLKKEYILKGRLDGYTTLSIPDSIASIRDDGRIATSYKKQNLVFFEFLQNLLKRISAEKDAEKKQLLLNLYNSTLLLLETDSKTGFISAGISEYAFQPFGHMSSDSNYIPMTTTNSAKLFEVLEEKQQNGIPVKRVIRVKKENIEKFIEQFVAPDAILQPVKLFTTAGTFNITANLNNSAKNTGLLNTITNFLGNYIPLTEDKKYSITYDIAKYLFKDLGGFLWEPRSNVFVLNNSAVSNRSEKLSLKYILKDGKSVKPVTIGLNDFKITENVAENIYAYFYKILNMLVSNIYWNLDNYTKGQLEVYKLLLPGGEETINILEGPFFQPLNSKKILKFENSLQTFALFHSFLEKNTGVQSEYTKLIRTNYDYFKNISQEIVKYGSINDKKITGGFKAKKLNITRRNRKNRYKMKGGAETRRNTMLIEEQRGGRSSNNAVSLSNESLKNMSTMMKLPVINKLFAKIPVTKNNMQTVSNTGTNEKYKRYTGESTNLNDF
jgi:hypothetical protein